MKTAYLSIECGEKTACEGKNREGVFLDEHINRFITRLNSLVESCGSIREFAKRCDLSDRVVRDYLNGKTTPSLRKTLQIAHSMDCSYGCLLGIDARQDKEKRNAIADEESVDMGLNKDIQEWLKILKWLSIDEKRTLIEFIAMHGVSSLVSLCDKDNYDLIHLPRNVKKAALVLKEYPSELTREILSYNERDTEHYSSLAQKKANGHRS